MFCELHYSEPPPTSPCHYTIGFLLWGKNLWSYGWVIFLFFFFSNCLFFFSLLFCGEDLKSEYTFCFLKNNLHVSILSVNLTECSQSWHVVFSSRSKLIKVENFEAYFKKQQADSNCGFAEEYEVCGCWMLSLYLLYVFPESWENCFCFMVKLWVRGSLFEGREKVFFFGHAAWPTGP